MRSCVRRPAAKTTICKSEGGDGNGTRARCLPGASARLPAGNVSPINHDPPDEALGGPVHAVNVNWNTDMNRDLVQAGSGGSGGRVGTGPTRPGTSLTRKA